MEMPDIESTAGKGIFDCPELLDKATVFIGGASDARFNGCVTVVAVPAPEGK